MLTKGNFSHFSISGQVAPSSMQKLQSPLVYVFVGKRFFKNFGEILDIFELPMEEIFYILKIMAFLNFLNDSPVQG